MRTLCSLLLAVSLLAPAVASACASCACGDATLTTMGTEQPFAGRLRLATTVRAWGLTAGAQPGEATSLRELRVDVSAAWAPVPWLFLSATLPLQARELQEPSLARESAWGPGEAELGARLYLWRDKAFAPNHLVSLLVGAKLPTSPTWRAAGGQPLSLDAQLGTGSLDPFAGLAWMGSFSTWSLFASATGYVATSTGPLGFRPGPSLRTTLAAQWQPTPRWALRLASDTRLEAVASLRGEPEPFNTGFVAYASPDVIFSPVMDVVVQLGVRVPVLNLLRGAVQPSPILQTSVAVDL